MSSEFLDKFHHLLLLILRFKFLDFFLFILLFPPILKIFVYKYKYQEMKKESHRFKGRQKMSDVSHETAPDSQ